MTHAAPDRRPDERGRRVASSPAASRTRQRGPAFVAKRALDRAGAAIVLLLAAPVLAAAVVAIRMTSPGPALFRQERVGRFEQPFTILKLRTMRIDADERVHREHIRSLLEQASIPVHEGDADGNGTVEPIVFKLTDDDRITPVGRFLRKSSIDELPQLINVLRGEMSLVGPRPDVPEAVTVYEPWHRRRFDVLPGMTGLWQVSGRDVLSPAQMLELDVRYADTWTLRRDLVILVRTIPAVLAKLRHGTA
ncbi:MAG: sugar transferase [Nitriliruptoraceae bacterium]